MKNIIAKSLKLLIFFCGVGVTLSSCEYKQIVDADYPDQKIYMPAAIGGNYIINDTPTPNLATPTPGQPYKFTIDLANKKFNVPLGVYRSGINNAGGFTVDIAVNTDTITSLIAAGKLTGTILLASDKYSIVSSVVMPDGEEFVTFDLSVNLDSLSKNAPNKKYALGVGISSAQRATNPKYSTTIVVIDTKMMKPTANFTSSADAANSKKINFKNTTSYGMSYTWDFGDGTTLSLTSDATSLERSPSHIYTAAGTYTVTLTAIGVTGEIDKSTKTTVITVL